MKVDHGGNDGDDEDGSLGSYFSWESEAEEELNDKQSDDAEDHKFMGELTAKIMELENFSFENDETLDMTGIDLILSGQAEEANKKKKKRGIDESNAPVEDAMLHKARFVSGDRPLDFILQLPVSVQEQIKLVAGDDNKAWMKYLNFYMNTQLGRLPVVAQHRIMSKPPEAIVPTLLLALNEMRRSKKAK